MSDDFSGWNCTPPTAWCSTAAAELDAVAGRPHAAFGDGGGVGVGEVDLVALVHALEQPRVARAVQRVPSHVRHLERRGACRWSRVGPPPASAGPPPCPADAPSSSVIRLHMPGSSSRPGWPGASALPSNSHCMPTQMPRRGRSRAMWLRMAACHSASEGRCHLEVADAGHDDGVRRREIRRRGRGRHRRSQVGQRLAHRRQVAGAVVNQRNHRATPFPTTVPWCSAAAWPCGRPCRRRPGAPARTP